MQNKKHLFIIFLTILITQFLFSQGKDDDYRNWKHFKIFCSVNHDSAFNQIQNILKFDVKYEYYSLRIDIRSSQVYEQFIYLDGDYYSEPKRRKWNWMLLPLYHRNYLIEYKPDVIIKTKLPD